MTRLVAILALVALCTGCGGSSKKSAAPPAVVTGNLITIKDFAFKPTPLTVHVGQKITVANQDDTTHTLTADNHSFDTHDLKSGTSTTLTFTKVGTFTYHCSIHNFMTGVIHVEP